MGNFPSKILLIDQDQTVLNRVESILQKQKIPVIKALSWEQAIYHYNQNRVDLVICQKNLDQQPASLIVQKFRNHEVASKRNPAFIVTQSTAMTAEETHIFRELGEIVTINKPIKEATLLSFLSRAMEEAAMRTKLHTIKIDIIDPLIESGDFEKASSIAEGKLLQGSSKSRFLASYVFEEAEKYERSLDTTGKLHQEDSNNLSYINQLARLKMKTGNFDEAKEYFEKADELAPFNIHRLEDMAALYLEMKAPEKSIEKYKDLIKFNPEDPSLKYQFFQNLQDAGFEKEAQEFCKETTGAMELIRHFNNRGVMLSKEGKFIDAIDEYDKACKLIPNSKELYRILYNKAISHINLKTKHHVEMAEELLLKVLELKPDYQKAKDKIAITSKALKKEIPPQAS